MNTTKRRVPAPTLVTKSAIEQATLALQELPSKPKQEWSLREAVNMLRDAITAALDKGYSYEEVALMLKDRGVHISPSSLRYYLTRAKQTDDEPTGRGRSSRRGIVISADLSGIEDLAGDDEDEIEADLDDEVDSPDTETEVDGAAELDVDDLDIEEPDAEEPDAEEPDAEEPDAEEPDTEELDDEAAPTARSSRRTATAKTSGSTTTRKKAGTAGTKSSSRATSTRTRK
jgi:hypothetical protein